MIDIAKALAVRGVGSTNREDHDFAGEHWAALFARGGTITEEAVRAWLAARSTK